MVEQITSRIRQNNYNTIGKVATNPIETATNTSASSNIVSTCQNVSFGADAQQKKVELRTTLSGKDEQKKYTTVLSKLNRNGRKITEKLLKSGTLLNSNSNDGSTVLDNLYKIATEPRATGLDTKTILNDTIATIYYPFLITQHFGDVPKEYRKRAIEANTEGETNLLERLNKEKAIDVEFSSTCVAASTEFKLAKQMPAEFARFAQELSSPKLSVEKTIKFENLTDKEHLEDALWLLQQFKMPYEADDYVEAKLKFMPDKKAILRAQIQTTHKDPGERTPLDVLMQSTFMQIGSQQTYNSLSDTRGGEFNNMTTGLNDFEKTFTESVVFDKNILSVVYQTIDENTRLVGYETDFETIKRQLTSALDEGENVIIGYTETNSDNVIEMGHEITLIGYEKTPAGKINFIYNDTDDDVPYAVKCSEDVLLPRIHHAALPQHLVEGDLKVVPNSEVRLEQFKETADKNIKD